MTYPAPIGVTKSLKKLFILAFREGLKSANLQTNDPVIKRLENNVSAEYPVDKVKYPSLWITTSFNRLSWQDMNPYYVAELPGGAYKYKIGELEASINVEILALSNEERDAITDAMANMILFGHVESDSNRFLKFLINEPYLNVTPILSELSVSPEAVTFGSPWNENQIVYTRSISFKTYGEFAQRLDNNALIDLREINLITGGDTYTV